MALPPTPPNEPAPVRRPAKVARQLALAHHLQAAIDRGAIDRGAIADQAALARKLRAPVARWSSRASSTRSSTSKASAGRWSTDRSSIGATSPSRRPSRLPDKCFTTRTGVPRRTRLRKHCATCRVDRRPIERARSSTRWLHSSALHATSAETRSKTPGALLKSHGPSLAIPRPLGAAVEKAWGYASEVGRHLQEGREPSAEEAELVTTVCAAVVTYLVKKQGTGVGGTP